VSTVKKSQATAAWECRNWDQVTSDRFGAGPMPLVLRIFHPVDEAMRWPRPTSSPWMRRYPQVGFSTARRRMSRRISFEVGGRPGPRVGCVQCLAMRRRCHRRRVSGVTIQPFRRWRGSAAAMAPSRVRSLSLSAGRSVWRRSTASWCRSTMISSSLERPDRTASRASMVMRRYRIRFMDHQGRSTFALVNTHDRIFGPHRRWFRCSAIAPAPDQM